MTLKLGHTAKKEDNVKLLFEVKHHPNYKRANKDSQ